MHDPFSKNDQLQEKSPESAPEAVVDELVNQVKVP
jgi:hypothetical protein